MNIVKIATALSLTAALAGCSSMGSGHVYSGYNGYYNPYSAGAPFTSTQSYNNSVTALQAEMARVRNKSYGGGWSGDGGAACGGGGRSCVSMSY